MDDSFQRKRFCEEVDRDFSVIAPAGVGKTYSIVERICNMAQRNPQTLCNLYVITYTKKAAEELRRRVFDRLSDGKFNFSDYLSHCFFGTIHSLCWEHIHQFNAERYELCVNDAYIKKQFLADCLLDLTPYAGLLQWVELDTLLDLTDDFSPNDAGTTEWIPELHLDLKPIYNYDPEPRNKKSILKIQNLLKIWETQYLKNKILPPPECSVGGEGFKQVFYAIFKPFFSFFGKQALGLIRYLAKKFFEYKIARGYLTHNDLIYFAERCLKTQVARDYFANRPISILLDEAQDTDAHQFNYLYTLYNLNKNNRFSMVGDPQQSIYARADLQYYRKMHQQLIASDKCSELTFSKTFRCAPGIVHRLNQHFPQILSSRNDPQQVDYVPLSSASKVEGDVQFISLGSPPEGMTNLVEYEVQKISVFLKQFLQNYQQTLSDICLITPRNAWLSELKGCFSQHHLDLQIYSTNVTYREIPLFCNVLAFVHLLNCPNDRFEIVGILHGFFQFSETEITKFSENLNLLQSITTPANLVENAIKQLHELRVTVLQLPPWQGIQRILSFFKKSAELTLDEMVCKNLILDAAFQAQTFGETWSAIEFKLMQYIDNTIERETGKNLNALQGFSCHKAKGLEWETVILPFFYRPIRHHTKTYPFIFNNEIVWNRQVLDSSALFHVRKRELQRLLYVACTRAKKNLIIIDDRELWPSEPSHPSFGELYSTK